VSRVAGPHLCKLVRITLELPGLENVPKSLVRVRGPLGQVVKLARLGAKVFFISQG